MRGNLRGLAVFGILAALCAWSAAELRNRSVGVLLVRTAGTEPEAFRFSLGPRGGGTPAEVLILGVREKEALREAARKEALPDLGGTADREIHRVRVWDPSGSDWPWYFGGGFAGVRWGFPGRDNLSPPARWFLALWAEAPPAPRFAPAVPVPRNLDTPPLEIPLTEREGPLQVEILNGCGIKNAADGVARMIKSPGLKIVRVDNADHFRYPKTRLRTSVGTPVAVEEILRSLGLSAEALEEKAPAPGEVDVTVVVGKDYPEIRKRARERTGP